MNQFAFIFPGQGSQRVGMLSKHIKHHENIRETLSEASSILDFDVIKLIMEGPNDVLNLTENAQPVILAASVALWRYWQSIKEEQPQIVAGHSLGEYSALVCAGVIAFHDALKLVKKRGELMQSAVPKNEGAMAAVIGMQDDEVSNICRLISEEKSGVIVAANFNAPSQVVISGKKSLVDSSVDIFLENGARKVLLLPVSVPSHCALMKPAADIFSNDLNNTLFNKPKITVIQNVTADMEDSPDIIRENLIKQLYFPVRWVESIKKIYKHEVSSFYECGPGKVLTGLNKRIIKEADVEPIETLMMN